MNIFKGALESSVRFFKAVDKGFRGAIPSRDKPDWEHDSRQVLRAKLRIICFNEMSQLDVSRRIRRLMSRKKAARMYRAA